MIGKWIGLGCLVVASFSLSVLGLASSLPPYSIGYDSQRDPFADGHAALAAARESQRKVVIAVGGNWCQWCQKLEHAIHTNPELYQAWHQAFVVLKVNVSEENENSAFLKAFPPPLGYPHLYVADAQGTLLHSQDTAVFLEGDNYSTERLLQFAAHWK